MGTRYLHRIHQQSNHQPMREILFRAKRLDNGEWVEGFLYRHDPPLQGFGGSGEPPTWWIHKTGFADWSMPRPVEQIEVDPSTVGQLAPTVDNTGKRIWEGDLILIAADNFSQSKPGHEIVFGNLPIGKDDWGMEHKTLGFVVKFNDGSGYCGIPEDCIVIGSVHDKQEKK